MLLRRCMSGRLLRTCTGTRLASSSSKTHFGFEDVDEAEKQTKVNSVFDNVATRYDLMNDLMSMGIHRRWKDYFVDRLQLKPNARVLDVAGGTGDIAYRIMDKAAETNAPLSVTVCDISGSMLEEGKLKNPQIAAEMTWEVGNAEALPFESDSFDLYTIAFGIRNCTHLDKVLSEAHRVLRPGGRFACLEFSRVKNPVLSRLYDAYSFQVIPPIGHIVAGDWYSYQYLVESIRRFPDQEQFLRMIRHAGFKRASYRSLSFGVVALHSGYKD